MPPPNDLRRPRYRFSPVLKPNTAGALIKLADAKRHLEATVDHVEHAERMHVLTAIRHLNEATEHLRRPGA